MVRGASPEKALEKILQSSSCPPVVLIAAPDEVRRRRAAAAVMERFFGAGGGRAAPPVQKFDARELHQEKLDLLADELNSLSLFGPVRAIVIEHLEKLSAAAVKRFAALIQPVPAGISLILLAEKAPESGPVHDALKGGEHMVVFPELSGEALKNWVRNEMLQAGIKKHAAGLVDLLIGAAAGGPDEIVKMIEQLALFTGGERVMEEDFFQLFSEILDPKDWELLDAIERKDFAKAEATLDLILANGRSPLLLLSSFYRTYATYLTILGLLRAGRSSAQIQESLGMKPWLFNKQFKAAASQSMEKVKSKLGLILAADSRLKNRSVGAEAICSELIYQLAA